MPTPGSLCLNCCELEKISYELGGRGFTAQPTDMVAFCDFLGLSVAFGSPHTLMLQNIKNFLILLRRTELVLTINSVPFVS